MKFLLAMSIGLMVLTGCSNELPSCNSKETISLIEKIINQKGNNEIGRFVELKEIEEEAYNKKRQLRTCFATIVTMKVTEDISYSINWQNNKKRKYFYVEITGSE